MERYVVHVTKLCNLNCLYCYEKDKISQYTWKEIKKFIDKLLEYRTSDEFGIEFLGGEPMIAWDNIKKAYEYLESKQDVFVHDYIITTNGTILNDDVIDYLSKNKKIVWAVSLDGHIHANQFRIFKENNKNSYDVVMSNIQKILENKINFNVHMVAHPFNVSFINDSVKHLYNKGIKSIDIGTVESTMKIDSEYCDRFIKELDIISEKIVNGEYKNLSIGLFNYLKPYEDIRSYIKDPVTGKTIAESYGRSGNDITHKNDYNIIQCTVKNEISEMIYYIRKTVYNNHRNRLNRVG